MGTGTWSKDTYDKVSGRKISSGSTFSYTASVRRSGVHKAHDGLKVLDAAGRPFTRESRDSDEHPASTPIVIGFDETGSMGENPAILQRELKALFGMLVRRDAVSDPQIAIGAYGDTEYDRVPVQLSQFESDNRIDDNLDNVYIEGCGGGNHGEMSTALAWFVARHVVTDAWEKRGKKGYVFLIGDECALPVGRSESKEFLGEAEPVTITPEMAFAALRERWDVWFLLVDNYAAKDQGSKRKYSRLLGADHVVTLETTKSAPAVIAAIIAMCEGTMTADEMTDELALAGFDEDVVRAATMATGIVPRRAAGVPAVDGGYADLGL